MIMRQKLLAILIFFVLAGTALCQVANNSPQIRNQPSTNELFAVVLILVLFAGIPLILNMYWAHKHLTEMHKTISVFVETHQNFDQDKLLRIMQDCIQADPSGAPGTARGVMALSVTLIVGICLFFLLTYPDLPNTSIAQYIKEVLLTLTGALTAIIGFYFGGKAGEATQQQATQQQANQQQASQPPANQPPANQPPANLPPVNQPPANPTRTNAPETKAKSYKIKTNFNYNNDQNIAGNIVDLSNVPPDILADWVKKGMVEPFS